MHDLEQGALRPFTDNTGGDPGRKISFMGAPSPAKNPGAGFRVWLYWSRWSSGVSLGKVNTS